MTRRPKRPQSGCGFTVSLLIIKFAFTVPAQQGLVKTASSGARALGGGALLARRCPTAQSTVERNLEHR